jgi:hypothetical protein
LTVYDRQFAVDSRPRSSATEPAPLSGAIRFEEGDFHALSERLGADPQYDDRRLIARRKLLALGKEVARRAGEQGLELECRTSLHHPHAFNGQRVRRLWAYVTRGKKEKRRLKGVLGGELGKDLDAAYRNAYLCLALEEEALEASLRIHPEGWYDGQNLVNRVKKEGRARWRELLNALPGFHLRLHDWKGEWRCGELTSERLEEFLKYYVPGEHRLAVERRFPAPAGARGVALEPAAAAGLVDECLRLLPFYRYAAWSEDSSFLFSH